MFNVTDGSKTLFIAKTREEAEAWIVVDFVRYCQMTKETARMATEDLRQLWLGYRETYEINDARQINPLMAQSDAFADRLTTPRDGVR